MGFLDYSSLNPWLSRLSDISFYLAIAIFLHIELVLLAIAWDLLAVFSKLQNARDRNFLTRIFCPVATILIMPLTLLPAFLIMSMVALAASPDLLASLVKSGLAKLGLLKASETPEDPKMGTKPIRKQPLVEITRKLGQLLANGVRNIFRRSREEDRKPPKGKVENRTPSRKGKNRTNDRGGRNSGGRSNSADGGSSGNLGRNGPSRRINLPTKNDDKSKGGAARDDSSASRSRSREDNRQPGDSGGRGVVAGVAVTPDIGGRAVTSDIAVAPGSSGRTAAVAPPDQGRSSTPEQKAPNQGQSPTPATTTGGAPIPPTKPLAGTTKTPLEAARSAVEVYRERLARVPKVLKNPVIGEDKPKRDRGEGKAVSNAIDIMENIMEKKSDSNILHDKQQLREKYENKEKTKGIAQPQPNLRPPSTPRKKQSVGRVLGIGD